MLFSLASVSRSSAAPAAQPRDRDGAPPGATPAQPGDGAAPRDKVTLSREAQDQASGKAPEQVKAAGEASSKAAEKPSGKAQAPAGGKASGQLTAEQQRQLTELQQRDTHVRQHEAAHQAAGGALAGGASFSYQTGPDGKSYAVGGEVPISMQAGRTPDETIASARRVRAAALAPSDPSAQDLSVAAAATSMELAANVRKAREATRAYGKVAGARRDTAEQAPQDATQAAAPAVGKAA